MNREDLSIVAIFIGFALIVIFCSTGESFPVPTPKTKTVTVPSSVR